MTMGTIASNCRGRVTESTVATKVLVSLSVGAETSNRFGCLNTVASI